MFFFRTQTLPKHLKPRTVGDEAATGCFSLRWITKQIFRLEQKTGTIAGGCSAFLRWRFLPLEAKEYVIRIAVRTERNYEDQLGESPEEQSLEISLRGVGYDPRTRDPHRLVKIDIDCCFCLNFALWFVVHLCRWCALLRTVILIVVHFSTINTRL